MKLTIDVTLTPQQEFNYLRAQGFRGSINDMRFAFLADLGYEGSINDRLNQLTGGALPPVFNTLMSAVASTWDGTVLSTDLGDFTVPVGSTAPTLVDDKLVFNGVDNRLTLTSPVDLEGKTVVAVFRPLTTPAIVGQDSVVCFYSTGSKYAQLEARGANVWEQRHRQSGTGISSNTMDAVTLGNARVNVTNTDTIAVAMYESGRAVLTSDNSASVALDITSPTLDMTEVRIGHNRLGAPTAMEFYALHVIDSVEPSAIRPIVSSAVSTYSVAGPNITQFVEKDWTGIGDSIVVGVGDSGENGFVDRAAQTLLADNLDRTGMALAGAQMSPFGLVSPADDSIIARCASNITATATYADQDLLVISYGTNDFNNDVPVGTPTDVDPLTFYGAANVALNAIEDEGTFDIVLCTPPHRSGETTANAAGHTLEDYRVALRAIGLRHNITVVEMGTLWDDATNAANTVDGLHPNDTGAAAMADQLVTALEGTLLVPSIVDLVNTPVVSATSITDYAEMIGARTLQTGSRWAVAYKDPSVDTLPTGATVSGQTVTISGNDVVFEGWDIEGYIVVVQGTGAEIRDNQNLGAETPISSGNPLIRVTPTADNCHIHHNTIEGQGYGNTAAFVDQQTTGTTASDTCSLNLLVEYNDVSALPSDYFKTAGNGSVVRFNRLGKPRNYPAGTSVWDSATTYDIGDLALHGYGSNGQFALKRSLVSSNLNNEPGSGASAGTTEWEALDPHVDLITCFASIGAGSGFYGNWLDNNTGGDAVGITNWMRPSLNGNAMDLPMNAIHIIGNVMPDGTFGGFNPIDPTRAVAHAEPIYLRHNVMNPGISGSYGFNGLPQDVRWDTNHRFDGTPVVNTVLTGTTAEATTEPNYDEITVPRVVGGEKAPSPVVPTVIMIEGQSEIEYMFNTSTVHTTLTPPTLAAENLTVYRSDPLINSGAPFITEVTQAEIDAGNVNPSLVVVANMLHHNNPNHPYIIADGFREGRDFESLVDDTRTNRSFVPFQDVIDLLGTNGHEVDLLLWWHYNSTASSIKTFGVDYAPGILGQYYLGGTYPLGTTHTASVRDYQADHILFDGDAAADQLGRGVFRRSVTKMGFIGPMPFRNGTPNSTPEMVNFTELDGGGFAGTHTQLDRPAWDKVKEFEQSTQMSEITAGTFDAGHLALFGGPTGYTHPHSNDPLGLFQMAQTLAMAILKMDGTLTLEPAEIVAVTPDATDPKVFEVEVSLPNGGDLTTIAAIDSLADDTTMPHFQDVMGFELQRGTEADSLRRPIFSDATYPSDRRGTVTITDSGSGVGAARRGVIQVTMVDDVLEGSVLDFLRGGRSAALLNERDAGAMKWMPVEYVSSIDPGGVGKCYGIPVTAQPTPLTITGVAAGSSTPTYIGDRSFKDEFSGTQTLDATTDLNGSTNALTLIFTGLNPTGVTRGAVTGVQVGSTQSDDAHDISIWTVAAGSGDISITTSNNSHLNVAIVETDLTPTMTPATEVAGPVRMVYDITDGVAGELLVGVCKFRNGNTPTWTGLTQQGEYSVFNRQQRYATGTAVAGTNTISCGTFANTFQEPDGALIRFN